MRVELVPVEGGDRISLALARVLNAEIQRRKEGAAMVVQRFGVGLNQAARLPDRNGFMLSGTAPALNLDAWLPLVATAGGDGPQPANAPPSSATFDLKAGTFDAFGKRLNAVTLRARPRMHRDGQAHIAATEMTGDLSYRNEGRGKLTARLTHFTPPALAPGADARGRRRTSGRRPHCRALQLSGQATRPCRGRGSTGWPELADRKDPPTSIRRRRCMARDCGSRGAMRALRSTSPLNINDIGKYLDRMGTPESVKGGTAKLGRRADLGGGSA